MKNENNVSAEYGKDSFTCPNCQTYAHQNWNEIHMMNERYSEYTVSIGLREVRETIEFKVSDKDEEMDVQFDGEKSIKRYYEDDTLALSTCTRCSKESIWVDGKIVFPNTFVAPLSNIDMPEDVKDIYNEARTVYDLSPRSAMALLRLALEILLPQVGATKASINEMIGQLVKEGLPERIQKALDILRVTGNEAVHAGEIVIGNSKDKENALTLFKILNFIIDDLVTRKNTINDFYEDLPNSKKAGIANRDRIKK